MAISDVREMCESIKYNLEAARSTQDLKDMKEEILALLDVLSARITAIKDAEG